MCVYQTVNNTADIEPLSQHLLEKLFRALFGTCNCADYILKAFFYVLP